MRHNPTYGIMAEFMKKRRIVIPCRWKLLFQRQMDGIRRWSVIRMITGSVLKFRICCLNKLFSLFKRVPGTLTRRRRRNSVNLFGVKHICDKHLRAFQADLFRARFSISVNNRATIGILDFALLIKAPVLHLRAFFALPNLIALGLRLTIGHPARVAVSARQ
jgi:hypothetical protein